MEDVKKRSLYIPSDAVLDQTGAFYTGQLTFVGHLIGCMSFIGGVLVSFFGGVGLVSLPYDLIYDYLYMPQPISEKDFSKRKQMLLNYSMKLRDMGKSLENERMIVA